MSDAATTKRRGNRTDRRGRGPLSQKLGEGDSKEIGVTVTLELHGRLVEAARLLNLPGVGVLARWLLDYDTAEEAAARYLERARRVTEAAAGKEV